MCIYDPYFASHADYNFRHENELNKILHETGRKSLKTSNLQEFRQISENLMCNLSVQSI